MVGVADDGSIKDIKDEEKYMILKSCQQFIRPIIEPVFEEIYIDQKLMLVIHIPEGDCKPHLAIDDSKKWWAYIKITDKSVLASKIMTDVPKHSQLAKDTLIKYSETEAFLLHQIEQKGKTNLKTFCNLQKLSHKAGQKIIVRLILVEY